MTGRIEIKSTGEVFTMVCIIFLGFDQLQKRSNDHQGAEHPQQVLQLKDRPFSSHHKITGICHFYTYLCRYTVVHTQITLHFTL